MLNTKISKAPRILWYLFLGAIFAGCGGKKSELNIPDKPITAKVAMHQNRPSIFINGEPQATVLYALTDMPNGRWSWEELPQHNLKVFCERGVRLFQLDVNMEHMWKEDGSLDISIAQRQIQGLLEVCPDAAVFFRLHVNAPFWWQDKHREDLVVYADAEAIPNIDYGLQRPILDDPLPMERISLASQKWKEESVKMTSLFCQKLSKTKEGRAVAGIQVAGGVFGEWHYWGFAKNEPDLSKPMTEYFRKWIKAKYQTPNELQKAWKQEGISFDKVQVPGLEARKSPNGIFRSPENEQWVMDYFRCQHNLVSDHIIDFCKVVKENWGRPIITGTFYGYYFSVFGREVAGGHLDMRKMLESEYIDYISAPQCYVPFARDHGEVYRSRGLLTSCRLNGKLWLDEMDIEPDLPYHRNPNFSWWVNRGRTKTRRNMIYSLMKGMGLWFYDFGICGMEFNNYTPKYIGVAGWWDHPDIMKDIKDIKEIVDNKVAKKEPYTSEADVLYVYDTESCYFTASLLEENLMSEAVLDWNYLASFRSGVASNAIHIGDLQKVNLSQYKTIIFGNTYVLSAEQKAFIKQKVATDNRHIIWYYAPGYVQNKKLNLHNTEDVIGMKLKTTDLKNSVEIQLAKEPAQFLTGNPSFAYKFSDKPLTPAFVVDDSSTIAEAYYKETGEVAIASKKFDNYTSWYIAVPPKEEKKNILRYILKQSGAHQYIEDSESLIYAGWGMLFYYTKPQKEHTEPAMIKLKNGKEISLELKQPGGGVLLDAETGEVLLGND